MNSTIMVAGFLRTGYVPPPRPCVGGCKPTPDGSPAMGWMLIAFGAAAFLAAVVMLISAGRLAPAQGAASPEAAERASMDRVQREDLERREAEESRGRDQTMVNFAGGSAVVGVGCVALGWFLVANTLSAIDDHKKELQQAASVFVSVTVESPQACRQVGDFPVPPGTAQNPAPGCSPSPRDYARQQNAAESVYMEFKLETVYSPNFQADGEVTFHDTLNNRALCVRVPDTVSSADTDSYITSGACPDAPVVSSGPS